MLEFILPISLVVPGLWVLQLVSAKFRLRNIGEQLFVSYILSLTIIFSLLYLGCITNAFHTASVVLLGLVVLSLVHLFLLLVIRVQHSLKTLGSLSPPNFSTTELIVFVSSVGLLSIFVVFLLSRAILDSDVVQEYLPIAREIVSRNGFTYNNGYDYNIQLKPIGVSVLYAWSYIISGSTLSESFRLMPLIPMSLLILLNYSIAKSATESKKIGIISTIVFLVLPFNDRFLTYNAFYPDMFYYPLVFAAIYFLLEYFQFRRSHLLFWAGVGLGVASLLKAQTIYILISFVLVFVVSELRSSKKLAVGLCCLAPFYVLIPSILADSLLGGKFHFSVPTLTETQLVLLLSISALSSFCFYLAMRKNPSNAKTDRAMIKSLFKHFALLLAPFAVLSSLWYLNNLLRFGTLIWTSSIDLPNYDWALGVLKSAQPAQPMADVWHYLAYFLFSSVDPAIAGYVFLIPFLFGLFFVLKKRLEDANVLVFFGTIFSTVVLSTVAISLSSALAYNPRDLLPLAPVIAMLSAVGIVFIISDLDREGFDAAKPLQSLLFVIYFGFLSYVHSVLVLSTSSYRMTMISRFMSAFCGTVGLNLTQTSFQLSYGNRVLFVGDNILKIVSLSLIASIPVFAVIISRYCRLFRRATLRLRSIHDSIRLRTFTEVIFVIFLMLLILIFPRAEMLFAQGGVQGIKESQLKTTYGAFYEFIADIENGFDGGILTFESAKGLPYYMPGVKIVDLTYPANLAFLKDCLMSNSSYETVLKLRQLGINYLLFGPSFTEELDSSLNFTISKMMQNPELAVLSRSVGGWRLYTLGPYAVEKTTISLSDWLVYPQLTNASYYLSCNESNIFMELIPTDENSRITAFKSSVPKLNLSEYDYILVKLQGTSNSRILLRFFLDDGSSVDITYWNAPYTLMTTPFSVKSYLGKTLRGDAYLGLKSSDGSTSSIDILEISLIKMKG